VKLVFSSFLKKETMAQAAKWLNDQGIQLPRRVRGSGKVRGRIFQIDTVHSILRNPTYAGIRENRVRRGAGFEAEQTKANWEPIIDAGTFNRVQEQPAFPIHSIGRLLLPGVRTPHVGQVRAWEGWEGALLRALVG